MFFIFRQPCFSLSLLGNLRWLGKWRCKHKFYLFSCTCISMKGPLILPPSDISPVLADITRTLFCFAVFTRHWAGRGATFQLTHRGFSSEPQTQIRRTARKREAEGLFGIQIKNFPCEKPCAVHAFFIAAASLAFCCSECEKAK
jgi:hypothetical protein